MDCSLQRSDLNNIEAVGVHLGEKVNKRQIASKEELWTIPEEYLKK